MDILVKKRSCRSKSYTRLILTNHNSHIKSRILDDIEQLTFINEQFNNQVFN